MSEALLTPLQFIKGVGPRRGADLAGAGLHVLEDLLLRLPRRYEDRGHLQPIATVRAGDTVTICGEVLSCGRRSGRRGIRIIEMAVADSSGQIRVVFFNQGYLADVFTRHLRVVLFGKVDARRAGGGLQLTNPEYEVLGNEPETHEPEQLSTERIVPIYEKVGSVTSKVARRIVHAGLERLGDEVDDPIPVEVRSRHQLVDRAVALREVHFPPATAPIDELARYRTPAQRRLIFEECFLFQVGLGIKRREQDAVSKPTVVRVDDRIRRAALEVLPFRLTGDQKRALKEIVDDLQRSRPMNRLLQGDVGSGKTIVALLAALVAMENGLQTAVMAPTELLAEQHFLNLARLLRPSRFKAALLTGAMSSAARREVGQQLATGTAHLAVGTHALVQEAVDFRRLGLVVIDEQHRFGVRQRATLRRKGLHPDVLIMTATPIPRTLALTAYGDLDVSVIRELPPGRHPITTRVESGSRRAAVYARVRERLAEGRQAYVVYPLVEESEKLDLSAATEMAEELTTKVFPEFDVGLVHGRMSADEREAVMASFVSGAIDLLVATTVIEVGVDVANASVMVIENAERFGLAQLHQLRGRVGRGPHAAECYLLHGPRLSDGAKARLDALASTTDGFEIAERDLEIRGPGDFFGTRQSGVPLLRVGDLIRDHRIMEEARQAAHVWLADRPTTELPAAMVQGWSERFGLVGVG